MRYIIHLVYLGNSKICKKESKKRGWRGGWGVVALLTRESLLQSQRVKEGSFIQ